MRTSPAHFRPSSSAKASRAAANTLLLSQVPRWCAAPGPSHRSGRRRDKMREKIPALGGYRRRSQSAIMRWWTPDTSFGFRLSPNVLWLGRLGWGGQRLDLRHGVRIGRRVWHSALFASVWIDISLGAVVVCLRRVWRGALVGSNVRSILLRIAVHVHLSRRSTGYQNQQRDHVTFHRGFSLIYSAWMRAATPRDC